MTAIAKVDCIVIGAGVIGLAVARSLSLTREVLILEAGSAIGQGTSSRSSEVIHAGLYYSPPSSLKAQLCVRGNKMLYAYCAGAGVPHKKLGKMVVATSDAQLPALKNLAANAFESGVKDLKWLTGKEIADMEPELITCSGGFLSPCTGIVDSHSLMLALQGEAEARGAMVAFHSPVIGGSINKSDGRATITTPDTTVSAALVVNCAGLHSSAISSSINGLPPPPDLYFAKGNYFRLTGTRAPFSRLVYPLPNVAGLGIHATIDLGGGVRFGPDVEWLLTQEPPDQAMYAVDPARAVHFEAAIRQYWPGLPDGALAPDYSGVRPKLVPKGAASAGDFMIKMEAKGWIGCHGIESPGLTACLALGEYIAAMADR